MSSANYTKNMASDVELRIVTPFGEHPSIKRNYWRDADEHNFMGIFEGKVAPADEQHRAAADF